MSRSDRRYLERMNGGRWRVVVPVPRDLQKAVGKTKLKEALNTDSLIVANQLKYSVIARLRASLDRYRAGSGTDELTHEALALREALSRVARVSETDEYTDYDAISDVIAHRAEEIQGPPIAEGYGEPVFDPQREARGILFADIAFGRATPLEAPVQTFLAETKRWNARTRADFERALGYLKEWLISKSYPCTIEAVSRRVAGEFVSSRLVECGMAAATVNKYLSGLSGYWKWLIKKGYATSNVWEGQRAEKRRFDDEQLEIREFTSEELDKLFTGRPRRSFVYDAMAIAALTGARLGVIVSLKVRDCQGGVFHFDRAKHEKHSRLVPIHPDLNGLIAARMRGKKPDDDLFPELPPLPPGADPRRERGQPLTKAFGHYRKSLGVEEMRPDGRSRVNFHSFRHWFISSASRALNEGATGYSPWTIAEVVAHSKGDMPLDMTMSHYKAPDEMKARRACVEAVRLPAKAREALLSRYPVSEGPSWTDEPEDVVRMQIA